jgi:hypothetical protein
VWRNVGGDQTVTFFDWTGERTGSCEALVLIAGGEPMGVEYKHYLIPEHNTYKPRPEDLSRLVNALLDGGFVAEAGTGAFTKMSFTFLDQWGHAERTGCYAHLGDRTCRPFPCPCSEQDIAALGEQDFKLVWPVESLEGSGLKYPLSLVPELFDAYYDLELHLAGDFVYHNSEVIEPFDEVVCGCGQPLEYYETNKDDDLDRPLVYHDDRIYRLCPSCGKPFRPQALMARVRDGWTGESVHRPGGATYLFAVVIDCGKGFAREGWPIRASEEFIETVTMALGQWFYEVGDIY